MAPRSIIPALVTSVALAASSFCAGPVLAAPSGMKTDAPEVISAALDRCFDFVIGGGPAPTKGEGMPIFTTEPNPPLCGVFSFADRAQVDGMLHDKVAARPEGFARYKGRGVPGKTIAFEWFCSAPGEKNYLLAIGWSRSPEVPILGWTVRLMPTRDPGCDDPKAVMTTY